MKILLVCEHFGVHEQRFARAFEAHEHRVMPVTFDELNQSSSGVGLSIIYEEQPDVVFGGPLHLAEHLVRLKSEVPFVAVSYAYDLLYIAANNVDARKRVVDVLGRCDGLLADCHQVIEQAREYLEGSELSVCVAPWGLDKGSVTLMPSEKSMPVRERFGWDESKQLIISTRNFTPLHGVRDVAEAFVRLAKTSPSACLLLVGSGEDEGVVREIISNSGLEARVGFMGTVSEPEVLTLLRQADLYVSASVVDGISISLLQALHAGLPIVLSDVGGNREWKDVFESECFFPSGDISTLQRALRYGLEKFSRKPGQWREVLSLRADWDKNSQKIVDFVEFVVKRKTMKAMG